MQREWSQTEREKQPLLSLISKAKDGTKKVAMT